MEWEVALLVEDMGLVGTLHQFKEASPYEFLLQLMGRITKEKV
jgi:hypothetical protein